MGKLSTYKIFGYISLMVLLIVIISFFYAFLVETKEDKVKDFWLALNNITLIFTLIIVAYYTYETRVLRKAAVANNELLFRPIIVFRNSTNAYIVENKGVGVAFNAWFAVWDGSQFFVTPSDHVATIIPANGNWTFVPNLPMDSDVLREHFFIYTKIIDRIKKNKHAAIFCFYQDLFGNNLYSIANTKNDNFKSGMEHGNLGKDI